LKQFSQFKAVDISVIRLLSTLALKSLKERGEVESIITELDSKFNNPLRTLVEKNKSPCINIILSLLSKGRLRKIEYI
jgi:hypothetical protein